MFSNVHFIILLFCRKERKKLHDRLKQSLRKKRKSGASSTRGRQSSHLALQDLQLVNTVPLRFPISLFDRNQLFRCFLLLFEQQCNGVTMENAVEKDTETTLSSSKDALSANEPTALTHISQRQGRMWKTMSEYVP